MWDYEDSEDYTSDDFYKNVESVIDESAKLYALNLYEAYSGSNFRHFSFMDVAMAAYMENDEFIPEDEFDKMVENNDLINEYGRLQAILKEAAESTFKKCNCGGYKLGDEDDLIEYAYEFFEKVEKIALEKLTERGTA